MSVTSHRPGRGKGHRGDLGNIRDAVWHASSDRGGQIFPVARNEGFGGPVALCSLMERDLVEQRGWLDKPEMRDVIAVCQTMPGPLAVQVAIFIGYLRFGFWGAWACGWALILPASVMVAALAAAYVHFHGLPWLSAVIYGVSPAVIALILQSWWRLVRLGIDDRF
jgi:chromate transporter